MDVLSQLSISLASKIAAAAPSVVALALGEKRRTATIWRPGLIVASEQTIGERDSVFVTHAGTESQATLIGRDPGTNIALFRLPTAAAATLTPTREPPPVGSLAILVGATAAGAATGRLAMVHETGPEWHAMAGGRIDSLIRLDARLGADEGGPVLDTDGRFLGISTSGPHGRVIVIPAATIDRIAAMLLEHGHIPRGWLGVGLQPVTLSEQLQAAAGQPRGSMILAIVAGGPAEQAGLMAGDIILDVDGSRFGHGRRLSAILGPDRIGDTVPVRFSRAGVVTATSLTIAARSSG